MPSHTNVSEVERWASALGGAALAVYGANRRSPRGALTAAAGGVLIYRGATGRCPAYSAAGIDTSRHRGHTRVVLGGRRGINLEDAVIVNRERGELFDFWRQFDRLPTFMRNLVSVREIDRRRSQWQARGPAGRTVAWEAEIINEVPGELIGWRTVDGADLVSAGSVRFTPAPGGRGTEVRVHMQYDPPGGRIGAAVAWLFGQEPAQTVHEDLRRFKQLMEAGEIPTTKGQPRGR